MIEKVVSIHSLHDRSGPQRDLAFWLSKTPEERLAAVEFLRRQWMEIQRDYSELLASFNAQRVEYLIVGAWAMACTARPATPATSTFS